jgi:rhodanese-related sulfurtransferase
VANLAALNDGFELMTVDDLEITQTEVEAILAGAGNAELVDVREDWELARGVLPGARLMPLSHFQDFVPEFVPGREYIIYCEHGIRSLDVAAWLVDNKGISARSMQGGFSVWRGKVVNVADVGR